MKERKLRCPKCKSEDLSVHDLKANHSAFNGYHYTPSDYSAVYCKSCRYGWRTKSDKVYDIGKKEVPPPTVQ